MVEPLRVMMELGKRASLRARVPVRDRVLVVTADLEHAIPLCLHHEAAQHRADPTERPVLDDRLHDGNLPIMSECEPGYAAILAAIEREPHGR